MLRPHPTLGRTKHSSKPRARSPIHPHWGRGSWLQNAALIIKTSDFLSPTPFVNPPDPFPRNPTRRTQPSPPLSLQELGISVLGDLQRQRETILHSRDALAGVDDGISRSRAILSTMSRRITQNKLLMWGIVALLLGAIGLVIWAKLS